MLVEAERGLDFGRVNAVGDAALAKCGGCTSCEVGAGSGRRRPAERPEQPVRRAAAAAAPASRQQPQRPQVVRRAGPRDIAQHEELRRNEDEVRRQVAERAQSHKLAMRITDTEWQWDRNRLTIYFTAETRVDFRNLVRELATQFRTRIELRQIGVRDEAARLGGVGRCGREYCCTTWLTDYRPGQPGARQGPAPLAQSGADLGRLRPAALLPQVRARVLPRLAQALPQGRQDGRRRCAAPEKVIAVDIFRERVALRSDEHGSRIIAALDLRDEMERAASTRGDRRHPRPEPPRA